MKAKKSETCKICGGKFYAKGFCKVHYNRHRKGINQEMPKLEKQNPYRIEGESAIFSYFNKHHEIAGEFIVDKKDVERVLQYKWSELSSGYIVAYGNGKTILLHRFLTDCPLDKVVDHINHNKKDNRSENMRICTQLENNRNLKHTPRGYATAKRNGKTYYLVEVKGKYYGCYKEESEAKQKVKEILESHL